MNYNTITHVNDAVYSILSIVSILCAIASIEHTITSYPDTIPMLVGLVLIIMSIGAYASCFSRISYVSQDD